MSWEGHKYILQDEYKDMKIIQTVDMLNVWDTDKQPDKHKIYMECPSCKNINHPLETPITFELSINKSKYITNFKKRWVEIIYGTRCKSCDMKYKFKLICNNWHYPKLGQY